MIKLSDIAKSINEKHMWLKHELWEMWHKMKDDEILERIYRLEKLIKEQPKIATDTNVGCKWIPCSERLPEDETLMYWTTHEDGSLVMHGYKKRNGFIYNWEVDDLGKRKRQGQVIAWTPIFEPEPYKEEVTE